MGRGLSYHHVVLCKVRLAGAWIKGRVGGKIRKSVRWNKAAVKRKKPARKEMLATSDENVKEICMET